MKNNGKFVIEDAEIRAKITNGDLDLTRQVNSRGVKTEISYVCKSLQNMKVIIYLAIYDLPQPLAAILFFLSSRLASAFFLARSTCSCWPFPCIFT